MFVTQPPGAHVLDASTRARLGVTPMVLEAPAGDGTFAVILRKDGFEDARAELPTNADGNAQVVLVAKKRAGGKPRPRVDDKVKSGTLDPFAD
jgi:hypothetical protein